MPTYGSVSKSKRRKKKGRVKLVGNETPDKCVKRFSRTYDKLCSAGEIKAFQPFRNELNRSMEKKLLLKKIVLLGRSNKVGVDTVGCRESISPVLRAMKVERYIFVQLLCVINVHLSNDDIILLAEIFEKGIYQLKHFELMDCVFTNIFITRLARSFSMCSTLTSLVLDYNQLEDEGCKSLCEGLQQNRTLQRLSLNYCGIRRSSGQHIGRLINSTAISMLSMDGNDLECDGLIDLLSGCVRQAVLEAEERRMESERLQEQLLLAAEIEKARFLELTPEEENANTDERAKETDEKSKKPKTARRSRSKSKRSQPPPVGPWLHTLHVADNSIDSHRSGGSSLLMLAVQSISGLIRYSSCLQELDIEDNLILEEGGREILDALLHRKQDGLPSIKLRTTHRMSSETFTAICRLGNKLKKKKRLRRKKKK